MSLFLFQKNRFLGSDLKSYLGIQYGTFLLRKKKIVLLYVHKVVLVPFSEKSIPLALPNNLPPLPISTQKMATHSSGVVWAAAAEQQQWQCQGIGSGASVAVGVVAATTAAAVAAGGGDSACFARLALGLGH